MHGQLLRLCFARRGRAAIGFSLLIIEMLPNLGIGLRYGWLKDYLSACNVKNILYIDEGE